MTRKSPAWSPPPCFAQACIDLTLPQLAARYHVHHVTLTKHILRLPEDVLAARIAALQARRQAASVKGGKNTAVARKAAAALRRSKIVAPRYRDREEIADCAVRDATIAFEIHFCDVADRRGWQIEGYAA